MDISRTCTSVGVSERQQKSVGESPRRNIALTPVFPPRLFPLCSTGIAYTIRAENVRVETTVERASRLLDTTFRTVTHRESGKTVIRAADYRLPADVAEAVAAVFGLHGAPVPRPQVIRSQRVGDEPASVTPKVLYDTYSVGGVTVNRGGKNIQGVAEVGA